MSEEPQEQPEREPIQPSNAVQRARADLEAGREWKARERLVGHLAGEYEAEALDLLGQVNYAMRDLPAAGAAWFGTARRGRDVDEAVIAWRERHGDQFAQMWSSLPRSVREREGNKRVDALRRRAEQVTAPAPAGTSTGATGTKGTKGSAGSGGAGSAGAGSTGSGSTGGTSEGDGGVDAATIIAVALGLLFVACAVIGFVTLLTWLVPD